MSDYENLLDYATRARAAYSGPTELEALFGSEVFIEELPRSRVLVFVHADRQNGIQWVGIRGTHNFKNVFVDARAKVTKQRQLGVYLHGGFRIAGEEVLSAVRPTLDPQCEIRITGHSLGGAVAMILAALLHEDSNDYRIGTTVTFGQPMVTDARGVRKLRRYPLLRVVNCWDPVTMLPWILSRTHFELIPTFFFHHVGETLVLHKSGRAKQKSAGWTIPFPILTRKLLANHSMDLYVSRLRTLAGAGQDSRG